MNGTSGLGRIAVLDRGTSARRVLRAIRELSRAGEAGDAIALHTPADAHARFVWEAAETVALAGPGASAEQALRAARAQAAWLGPAPLAERAAFAEACARAGVKFVGAPAEALRRLAGDGALAALAKELGIPLAGDTAARRIEVVVARDTRGASRAIGIGEASLVRRGLAVVIESPPPGLEAGARARELAVRAFSAAGLTGVGAVSFALDARGELALAGVDAFAQSAPAIEAVHGVDLARLALRLAAGAPLEPEGDASGLHAVAARITAHDPEAPGAAPGRVELLRLPSGHGVRSDPAVDEGDDAPASEADPIATFVARGADRPEALARLGQALADADVLVQGAGTSKAWVAALLARPEVREARAGADLLQRLSGERLVAPRREAALVAAAVEAYEAALDVERARFVSEARRGRPRVGPSSGRTAELRELGAGGAHHRIRVRQVAPGTFQLTAGASSAQARVERLGRFERRLELDGHRHRVLVAADGLRSILQVDGVPHALAREPEGLVASPLPAVVVSIPVAVGQEIQQGEPVATVESMKVEITVPAPQAGVVREVLAVANAQVDAGTPLVRLAPLDRTPAPKDAGAPLALGAPAKGEAGPRERYLAALTELRRLQLGFDVAEADARRLETALRELGLAVPVDDTAALAAEDEALRAFADLQSLFSKQRFGGDAGSPPLEELWRYLHAPAARGEGLSPRFVGLLRRALAHYGAALDAPGNELELALLRTQKAYVRASEQVPAVLAILDRRLAAEGPPRGLVGEDAREVLDRLAEVGQERFPPLADLARELRFRRFDQPAFVAARALAYAQVEVDLAQLAEAPGAGEELVERLVEYPHPLATLLVSRIASVPQALRPQLVQALLRRYYRVRPLEPAQTREVDGVPCALADYELRGARFRVIAAFAPLAEADRAVRALARLVAETPEGREAVVEAYLWNPAQQAGADVVAAPLRAALVQGGFSRPLRRASFFVAAGGAGLGRQASQVHLTFRGGPAEWTEEPGLRGVHYMLAERMQLARLAKFDLERLPSVEDVYLYRAVAQSNPKDERLFAAAEVRDAAVARDASGEVRLPQLERMLHEALAGMRRFQARRAPGQRLEWNRVLLTVLPPIHLGRDEIRRIAQRLAPATEGLGLEMVLIDARLPDPATGELTETLVRVLTSGRDLSLRFDPPTTRPLEPLAEYQQKVVQLRRRGIIHPFELVKMLAPPADSGSGVPPGEFVEHDLDEAGERLVPVERPPGKNRANMIAGIVTSYTARYPEGMKRVVLLGDPSRSMGSLAEPECRIVNAALAKAAELKVPVEWFALSAGALISMQSGTENMDWISLTLRRIIEFTQGGGEINIVVTGINVGGQPYWNAEATMLMHTRGILVMTPGSAMVLTGKDALEYSGAVSAESNEQIGGYDRIMGVNGQAQYRADSLADAIQILVRHYDHTYVAPGERFPRRAVTTDRKDRDVRLSPHGPEGGAGFALVGDIWSTERNPDRKKPFDIRRVMAAAADQDHAPLERWRDVRGGETAVIWDAHVGGWPVCMIGIQSRPLPRLEFVPADGPEVWSAGTLFPQSSKKIARAINSASGNRPLVVLANLSGFDGSPESMRRLQLEYGAEIGRAVVNFEGPIVFTVVSRYHGGAFVVFAKTLREEIEVVAIEGSRASVIGGAPAAAVVFAREVETRARKDPRTLEAEKAAAAGGAAKARFNEVLRAVRSEKVGQVADEYDKVHTIERALKMGSVDRIIAPQELRPYLIEAVERGILRHSQG